MPTPPFVSTKAHIIIAHFPEKHKGGGKIAGGLGHDLPNQAANGIIIRYEAPDNELPENCMHGGSAMGGVKLRLFLTFAKIGAFTFGGGYAMIPLIQRETAEKQGWVSPEDILDVVAIAESTPGPIAINAATFIGYHAAGVPGAACATLGVTTPSFLIIAALSMLLQRFQEFQAVRYAFWGIRAGVLALILRALWTMYRHCPKSAVAYSIMGLAFVAVAALKFSALPVILLCAGAGLAARAVAERQARP